MTIGADIKLAPGFKKRVKGRYEQYQFQVGVLADGRHKDPKRKLPNLKTFAGGPARKVTTKSSNSISQVSEKLRKGTGINFYTKPFRSRKNKDILNFIREFLKLVDGRSQKKRVENLLQAVVRNPILRGDYGSNSARTVKIKGFNRFMIDTGQLFKAIVCKTKVMRKGRV